MDLEKYRMFAFVADGDVFHTLLIPKDSGPGLIEGLRSKPLLLEITDRPEIFKVGGWKFDYETETFYHPALLEEDAIMFFEEDYEVE
jgi:hypothetical protein